LTARVQKHNFIHQWNSGEAEGTKNTAASETPNPLAERNHEAL
jgi:hypothetical protein